MTVVPDFEIFKTITVASKSLEDLKDRKTLRIGDTAGQLLKIYTQNGIKDPYELDLVKTSVSGMSIPGKKVHLGYIFDYLQRFGLDYYPFEGVLNFCLEYSMQQPMNEVIVLGTKPINELSGAPLLFQLGRHCFGSWLGICNASEADLFISRTLFIFVKPRKSTKTS